MQLISKFNNGFIFLLCVIEIYSKYPWVIPLKYKKGTIITNAFQKILEVSYCKPDKTWVDKGREFYNKSMKSWLEKNDIEMYSTHNEGKSVIAERFIRTLTLIRLGFLRVVFPGKWGDGGQFDPPFIFQEELI